MAIALVRWRSAAEGGRYTGPPAGPRYAATAVFVKGDDEQVVPNWPAGGEHFSVLLTYTGPAEGGEVSAEIDFLARDQVADLLIEGATFFIMEGPHAVAEARVISTTDK